MLRCLFKIGLVLGLLLSLNARPVSALVKLDPQTIDAALIHGMQHSKMGYSALLGPNWIEGPNGALLNIYSPFMVLAGKAARGGFPANPKKSDVEEARKKYAKHIAFYKDPKNRPQVKFAVSMYGKSPDFGLKYKAHIEGFGRGKEFNVIPKKVLLDKIADPIESGGQTVYEAVNSYYFLFNDIVDLQDYRLILESPDGETISFRIRNERIY